MIINIDIEKVIDKYIPRIKNVPAGICSPAKIMYRSGAKKKKPVRTAKIIDLFRFPSTKDKTNLSDEIEKNIETNSSNPK